MALTRPAERKAYFIALWIGEDEPDFVSWLIQVVLTLKRATGFQEKVGTFFNLLEGRQHLVPYSHNALYFPHTGTVFHATMGERNGVIEDDWDTFIAGSTVHYIARVDLDCTMGEFHMWLKGELGKEYSKRQNLAAVTIPALQRFLTNGDRARNCSEFLARACQFGSGLEFPTVADFVLPTCTFDVILPTPCSEKTIPQEEVP